MSMIENMAKATPPDGEVSDIHASMRHRIVAYVRRVASLFNSQSPEIIPYRWFTSKEIRALFDLSISDSKKQDAVDDQTWSDLQMDRYLDIVVSECSIFGRQWLYRRLRVIDKPECFRELVEFANASESKPLDEVLGFDLMLPLRSVDSDSTAPLFRPSTHRPPEWVGSLWIIPLAFCAALIFAQFSLLGGIAIGMIALVATGWAQIRLYQGLVQWLGVRKAIVTLLSVACRLQRQYDASSIPLDQYLPGVRPALAKASAMHALLRPSLFEAIPALAEYTNLLGLYEYRRQRHHVNHVEREQLGLREILEAVGRLEALACLARHLQSQKRTCWSEPLAVGLRLDGVVSPFLEKSMELSLDISKEGILLTGKNGVGKSTLLRTIGLNVLMSGAFGFSYSRSASCSGYKVLTSMQVNDSLEEGKSTYMAELERAKQLLDASRAQPKTLVLIDEIFSGTNHLESISAGYAVLSAICDRSAVIAATHDVVLVPLLSGKLRPLRLVASSENLGSMRLEVGTIAETNGITMMTEYGFSSELVARAQLVHQWLAQYLSYPIAAPPVK